MAVPVISNQSVTPTSGGTDEYYIVQCDVSNSPDEVLFSINGKSWVLRFISGTTYRVEILGALIGVATFVTTDGHYVASNSDGGHQLDMASTLTITQAWKLFGRFTEALQAIKGKLDPLVASGDLKYVSYSPKVPIRQWPSAYVSGQPAVVEVKNIYGDTIFAKFRVAVYGKNDDVQLGMQESTDLIAKVYDVLVADRSLGGTVQTTEIDEITPGYFDRTEGLEWSYIIKMHARLEVK